MKCSIVVFAVLAVLSQGGNVSGGILDSLGSGINKFTMTLTKPIEGAQQMVGGITDAFTSLLTTGLSQSSDVAGSALSNTFALASNSANGFIQLANNAVAQNIQSLTDIVKLSIESMTNGVKLIVEIIRSSAAGIQNLRNIVSESINKILNGVKEQLTTCESKLEGLEMIEAVDNLEAYSDKVDTILNKLKDDVDLELSDYEKYVEEKIKEIGFNETEIIEKFGTDILNAQTTFDGVDNAEAFNKCIQDKKDTIKSVPEEIASEIKMCIPSDEKLSSVKPDFGSIETEIQSDIKTVCDCVEKITPDTLETAKDCAKTKSELLDPSKIENLANGGDGLGGIKGQFKMDIDAIKSEFDGCISNIDMDGKIDEFSQSIENCKDEVKLRSVQ